MHIRGVLTRRLVMVEDFDDAVALYETLFRQPVRTRFDYREKGLRVAQVGQVLLIGGSAASLEPFRATAMTFLVSDLSGYAAYLPTIGATIVRAIQKVPSGRNMLVRHSDQSLIEYVEHDNPNPADDVLGLTESE
ncbi:hypothetical protein SAMN05192583_2753 [Sphingomonas gellani]|uniref:VOC domain-containing protein n=1 Tax=Sphingomonas gellani TaxID=1166340 RepID=A0A1H8GG81_9SPHN|nr:glyoxalase [Sphingomonas gellani]SEN43046.1 hypothetical protein SAMN05192583_2753 [Sphingomonas gellani]